ncbi:Protein-glutamate O-methyltransferase [Schistosoma japonicum]|nr:Protein-glutamate O-methyltransferase [Schistosoma japonicum]
MLPPKLTFRNSEFALNTISERWPTILSQLIDSIYRNRETYCTAAQQDISDNLKELTRHICHLRYDIMTNKPVTFLSFPLLGSAEMELWEHLLSVFGVKLKRSDDIKPEGLHLCWYDLPWLFAECYLYRRIVDVVAQSGLNEFDPFYLKKQHSFKNAGSFISSILFCLSKLPDLSAEQAFNFFLNAALWANEFDLSLHPDGNFQLTGFDQVSDFMKRVEKQIVVNDGNAIHRFCKKFLDLMSLKDSDRKLRVAVILDNSGPELVADLCFAEYFVASHIAENVSFHGKSIPWFVSDVTGKDFNWLLNINNSELVFNNDSYVHLLTKWSEVWRKRIQDGSFHFRTSYFWTTPCTYDEIETVDSALYQDLSKNYDLIIFKGDLNYRKLLGDRQWKPDNPEDKINAFRRVQIGRPSSCTCSEKFGDLKPGEPITNCSCGPLVVALRVAKSDVAVGVDHDLLTELQKKTKQWWTIGKYGFIQVVSPIVFGAS